MPAALQDLPIRDHIGLAIDGGGVRGAMVAHGLIALEKKLGLDDSQPLISDPRLKVLAGTSTGALIATSLAVGMTGQQILDMYRTLGPRVFGMSGPLRPFGRSVPLLSLLRLPGGLLRAIQNLPLGLGDFLLLPLFPARYSFADLRAVIREAFAQHLPENPDPTLGEFGAILKARGLDVMLIITAVEVAARNTRFLKASTTDSLAEMKLVDAMLASSSIPTVFPPILLPSPDKKAPRRWAVDGGVGNFGNPALIAAWELCDRRNPDTSRHYNPRTVTLYSFGTGHLSEAVYRRTYGTANNWWALDWALRAPDLFGTDANLEQSRNLLAAYTGIDLRRFQLAFDQAVAADDYQAIDGYLKTRGQLLAERVGNNQHALVDTAFDPEGIIHPTILPLLEEVSA